MKRWIYILIAVSIIVSPFYIVESGYPQLSDISLFLAFIIFTFNYKFRKDKILIIIYIIVLLISITNLTWGIIYSNIGFIVSIAYYLFNFMFLIMIINLYYLHKNEVLETIYKAVFISLLIQAVISPLLMVTGSSRHSLFFNNPNQLGYYALLSFLILTLLFYILKKRALPYLLISVLAFYLALLSNSSAVILVIVVILMMQILILFLLKLNLKKKILMILLIGIVILAGSNYWQEITNVNLIQNALDRYSTKESKSQSVYYERRYNRVFENSEFIIFGAGEGLSKKRFGSGEIHSTFFSFLFNYGIITTFFLIVLLLSLLKRPTMITLIALFAIHFYGLTHNGIRQPLFWLVNVIIYIGNEEGKFGFNQMRYHLREYLSQSQNKKN